MAARFHLPWRLGSHRGACVAPETAEEDAEAAAGEQLNSNVLKYKSWLEDSAREQLSHTPIQPEDFFRVMDSNHSGFVSLDEFGQTWKLFNSHMNTDVTDDCVCNLVRSINFNKDGHIDINEFPDTFHLVEQPCSGGDASHCPQATNTNESGRSRPGAHYKQPGLCRAEVPRKQY
ncbi:Serine/Threonine-Protein Phosphatase With Ef-Hands 2 [Manis pentadactyla]|nr:Serine/Threonine-Protein Phosphatase With Ef-Hands 2 [Manis pentadactyla]